MSDPESLSDGELRGAAKARVTAPADSTREPVLRATRRRRKSLIERTEGVLEPNGRELG